LIIGDNYLILLLFTSTFPYDSGAEQAFLSGELHHLKKAFDRVILIPKACIGNRLPVSDEIEVDESLAGFLSANRFTALPRTLMSPILYRDIITRPSILIHPDPLKRLVKFMEIAYLTQLWTENWLERTGSQAKDCLFYTYWFDDIPMGIGLAKHRYPGIRLVSRAHGYDLYEERDAFNYWPCRPAALAFLNRLYLDSDAGRQYISKRYPQFESKYETALLGVDAAGFATAPSDDGVFRIVSCSLLAPVKRVESILEGIAVAARLRPGIRFEWHHFGNGTTRSILQDHANAVFPSNARGFLPGFSNQHDLFQFYNTNPVDVFINVSISEGTPVAVMEAMSCSIPVIATAVGGNREIVSPQNGSLLPPNPSAEEIATALLEMQASSESAAPKRMESFHTWQDKYNAASNFQLFTETLSRVRNE
jgi:colanic acid/amylovoran biosynthesis glycosyltransferase